MHMDSVSFISSLLSRMECGIVKEQSSKSELSALCSRFSSQMVEFALMCPLRDLWNDTHTNNSHILAVKTSAQHICVDPLPLCPLRTKQEQPEGNLLGGRPARKPQTGLPKWDGPFQRGRQRQPHCPSEAHIRGSPRLSRDPGDAAAGHGQEEGGLPGASEAEIPPSCLSDHGPPGKAARAGQCG